MNITNSVKSLAIGLMAFAIGGVISSPPAEAARIYNETGTKIKVCAGTIAVPTRGCIKIENGVRSDSLNWTEATYITVSRQVPDKYSCSLDHTDACKPGFIDDLDELFTGTHCKLNFGVHAQIQGGNYAVISNSTCVVYDSHHSVLEQASVYSNSQYAIPKNIPPNCAAFYTKEDGAGKELVLCGPDHNWANYINLGGTGSEIHSHHYDVKSFACGPGISKIAFYNGNKSPMTKATYACDAGNVVHPAVWVRQNGTGVQLQ